MYRLQRLAIPVVYIFGVAGFMIVTGTPFWASLPIVMLPYIPGDIVKCLVASWLATKIYTTGIVMAIERKL